MKNLFTFLAILVISGSFGQNLEKDQNPNYQISQDKYMEKSDELTSTLSTTIQDTYKAYDWREARDEKRQLRATRRYELRKLRIQNRPFGCNRRHHHGGWGNSNFWGSNNYGYTNYYQVNPYSNYYSNPLYVGAGVYSLFF